MEDQNPDLRTEKIKTTAEDNIARHAALKNWLKEKVDEVEAAVAQIPARRTGKLEEALEKKMAGTAEDNEMSLRGAARRSNPENGADDNGIATPRCDGARDDNPAVYPRPGVKTERLEFPEGFLWGTATSAYQVEGGNKNDWSSWETSTARKMQLIKEGKNVHDHICGKACDSYNRYKEDIKLAKSLNNNAIRFGLEWSRIQPKKDTWDINAVNHYREQIHEAKKQGFKTFVTLWHWTLPTWVAHADGWANKQTIESYLEYVRFAVKELGGGVDFWITMNEPLVPIAHGYLSGAMPPNQRLKFLKYKRALDNLVAAHRGAFAAIRAHFPYAEIGISLLANVIVPARRWTLVEPVFAALYRYYAHDHFYGRVKDSVTFVGLDYYRRVQAVLTPPFYARSKNETSDRGWEIYPRGLYEVAKKFARLGKPIYIIENGLADKDDSRRARFIAEHLKYLHQAIREGADVRGYFHWSLLDNFEWEAGWAPKFGLFAVDRETFARTARPSAEFYAKIAKENAVEVESE